ncbi:sigma-54 dependent transcriptional regulator [Sedimenticola selenatireducens]|uniref:sigma-54-dependent transcriptional regulator n=1 Tax=Sedimenticola selenatireducens TaxID=191960 RepID=UPI002AAB127C|nr:sigma-54 dependent transcriptional regulator [Sedimenticola selenatireducens]
MSTPELPQERESKPVVWIIDDEPDVAQVLARVVKTCGEYNVIVQPVPFDLSQALRMDPPDLVFIDLVMPDFDGFDIIRRIHEFDNAITIVVVSAHSTTDNAVHAVKLGAFDFLPKPFDPDNVRLILAKTQKEFQQRYSHAELKRQILTNDSYMKAIKGGSQKIRELREWIFKVRNVKANVLICGESGTGKELVTRAIHAGNGKLLAINMAAIPDELADSELFGHKIGAFTGATTERRGLLLDVNGGTLFLDEVNAMSMQLQAKLLRVIEERKVRPVGSNQEYDVEFRLISATNEDLDELVEKGLFRRDLYHRLKVLSIKLPPLRERAEDIPLLAEEFLQYYARAHKRSIRCFTAAALNLLVQKEWPGNVRELENLVEEAVILMSADDCEISKEQLEPTTTDLEEIQDNPFNIYTGEFVTLANIERLYIRKVLEYAEGNKALAARILKIDYKTLLRKLAVTGVGD